MNTRKPTWTLFGAIRLVHALESALADVGYHVGLTGSVLAHGCSENDLDIIVFPHSTAKLDPDGLERALISVGLTRLCGKGMVQARWRKMGSQDEKHVEIWEHEGRKVDLIFLA